MTFEENFLKSAVFEFQRYKSMGDRTFSQLNDADILWQYSKTDNSISQIVKHMAGNMLSRWTHFLMEDGEKIWRDRDSEFVAPFSSKTAMLDAWEKGWQCLFEALDTVTADTFGTVVKIRDEIHTIPEAVNRQLAHYAGHVGQIVVLGKMIKGNDWISLSIPKGESRSFNREKFGD